jgi:hypothetical protein
MENQNIKKSRGRPKKIIDDELMKTLQERQHNYYLNYKNKKNHNNNNTPINENESNQIQEEEPKHVKTMCELINDIIEKCNEIKSII